MKAIARALPRPAVALPTLSPRMVRRLLVVLAAVTVLTAGYQFWLRNSSFVAVNDCTWTTTPSTRWWPPIPRSESSG